MGEACGPPHKAQGCIKEPSVLGYLSLYRQLAISISITTNQNTCYTVLSTHTISSPPVVYNNYAIDNPPEWPQYASTH